MEPKKRRRLRAKDSAEEGNCSSSSSLSWYLKRKEKERLFSPDAFIFLDSVPFLSE